MYIYYLYKKANPNPIRHYLALSGRIHRRNMLPVTYESLCRKRSFGRGLYIFTDIELLHGDLQQRTIAIYEQLQAAPQEYRLFNHPAQTLTRFPLLRTLHEEHLNNFNIYRATDDLSKLSFPVFLRRTNDHRGPQTGLLADRHSLNKELERLTHGGKNLTEWLVTEFCNVADEHGVFRKYSSFIVGQTIIPRHLFFDKKWIQKTYADLPDTRLADEERAFQRDNLFQDQIRKIFKIAKLSYGRIDFGIVNGRVQTWEVNTNPMIIAHGQLDAGPRKDIHTLFFDRFRTALDTLIQESSSVRPGPAYLLDHWVCDGPTFFERYSHTPLGKFYLRALWKMEREIKKTN